MKPDPIIDDRMTANGYVRCGGCGGYIPQGAICGYCLQRSQAVGQTIAQAPPAKRTRPMRAALVVGLCALAVCGIGLGAVFVAREASHLARMGQTSSLSGLTASDEGNSQALTSKGSQQLIDALNSGDTQRALDSLQSIQPDEGQTLGAASTPPPATMGTQGVQSSPALQAASTQAPSTMATQSPGMPADVRTWLEHLRKIENARIALAAGQLQQAVTTFAGLKADDMGNASDEGSGSQDEQRQKENARAEAVGGGMSSMQQAWRTLLSTFDSVPAPAECAGIKANYDQVVGQTGSMILEIVGHIKSAQNDPQGALAALTAMQGTSSSKIDVPARAADEGIGSVCDKYGVSKWFGIQSDVGSGLMGKLGY